MTITYGPKLGLMESAATGEAHDSAFRAFLRGMDALIQASVKTIGGNTPPASPANGDCHIIGSSPTGAWVGNGGKLTRYSTVTAGWEFFTPKAGWVAFCDADSKRYEYSGSAWAVQSSGGSTSVDYSTSEHALNEKWINGKTIYRKVINFGALPNAATKSVAHGITNVETWLPPEAVFQDSAKLAFPFAITSPTGLQYGMACYVDATYAWMQTGVDRSSLSGYVILRYTKTT